jgi:recombination protein RecA
MAKKAAVKKESSANISNREAKRAALDNAIAMLERQYGKGAVMRLGSAPEMNVETIPTGSMALDAALGIGGVPKGRIVEIYGPESSGKTTVALHIAAEAQKLGGFVAFIDVEHALDPQYAKALGVNIDDVIVSQPDSGEQALEIAEALVRSGAIDCLVIDSVAAMTTRAEIEGEMGDSHVGQLARLMSQAMRKLTAVISKSQCVAIFINQVREKIGIMYGNPETTPGGRALKFYASVRIEVRKGETLEGPNGPVGARTKCKVVKNKVAPPFEKCEFDLMFGRGIAREGEVLDLGVKYEIIDKSGAWFAYNGERIGQGRENAREYLRSHPELMLEIEDQIKEILIPKSVPGASAAADTSADESATAAKPKKGKKVVETEEFDPAGV